MGRKKINKLDLLDNNVNKSNYHSKFLEHLLSKLNKLAHQNGYINNADTQKSIESLIMDEFDIFSSNNKSYYIAGVINTELLGPLLSKYIIDRIDLLNSYVDKLQSINLRSNTRKDKVFMNNIVVTVDRDFILNLCFAHFILVYIYQNSDNDKFYALAKVSVTIGKKIVNRYFNELRNAYIKKNKENEPHNEPLSFSLWVEKWEKENPELYNMMSDTFYSELGCKILEILDSSEMIKRVLVTHGVKQKQYVLELIDDELLNDKNRQSIINLPTKLPMIVKPKFYSKSKLGGYLLNDVNFREELFIKKQGYGVNSELTDNNKIYNMINKISSTPFKINVALLDYILNNNDKHQFLIDPNKKHKFHDIKKRTKYQQSEYNSHNSKIILQSTIMTIALFYKNFNEIYFTVRLDQRGRLYCSPHFFNYQSSELSKALLLFANPGIINKNDMSSINYLKAYVANCYGGHVSKLSLNTKLRWVDNNMYNIINYDNNILLSKAKDKLLFLSFCMEYTRFYQFNIDENSMEFHTYLPIQLDATCNGFQHMALLSNEEILFKELNLVNNYKEKEDYYKSNPNDFYNFLLHKIIMYVEDKINIDKFEDEETEGSYKRLHEFKWVRDFVKKAIMTISYNASDLSMKTYISQSLIKVEDIDKDISDGEKCNWYYSTEKYKNNIINDKDITLLVKIIRHIVANDFEKIRNLTKYLKNISKLLCLLELPIIWTLPTGLTIKQSYLETKSTTITPFTYSRAKINLKVSIKDKFDKNKQVRALMPNLIHSLDGTSLSLLFNKFSSQFEDPQFFSIHDCFGTTCDKVNMLKTILASVYTNLYSSDPYLKKFDKNMLDNIESNTNYKLDRKKRTLELNDNTYEIHDIEWVINNKHVNTKTIKNIDSQFILI